MKGGVFADAALALAADEQEASDPPARSRPLSSALAVVRASADCALAGCPERAVPDVV